jgi:hypothetical protein
MASSMMVSTTSEKGVSQMEIFRDSEVIIGWVNMTMQANSTHLQASMRKIRDTLSRFDSFSFAHIYRELNTEAYQLAKAILNLE